MAREDPEYVQWVREQPCWVADRAARYDTVTPCKGRTEAHHAGRRGMSQKAHDHTCVPLCTQHHREWHDASGYFRPLARDARRSWAFCRIEETQARWDLVHPDSTVLDRAEEME